MRSRLRRLAPVIAFLVLSACIAKAPPALDPAAVKIWQANEVVVIIGTAQHAAIELNKIQVCDPAPCHPLFSDHNTGIVVDAVTDGLVTLKALPGGWKPTGLAVLDRIKIRLDKEGFTKFTPYLDAGRAALVLIG